MAFIGTKSEDEKSQLRYFLIATLIGVPTGLTESYPNIQDFHFLPLGHIGCLAYSFILAIGVFKHRRGIRYPHSDESKIGKKRRCERAKRNTGPSFTALRRDISR